jgi:predicted acylesterase/phospholipase RssA
MQSFPTRRLFSFGVFLALVSLLTGCCSSGESSNSPDCGLPGPTQAKYQMTTASYDLKVHNRVALLPSTRPMRVLVLSGGGSNGAWGAGFLSGWASAQDDPRPQFDIVTGVSTGALIATGAFIADDDLLQQAYTKTTTADVQSSRFFLEIPFSDSLNRTGPLKALIAKYITDAVIDKVADGATEERGLYVATTNLNSGELVIWDLTAIAQDRNYDLYRKVVLASASVPALYPPVMIDDVPQVDGGVRASLFFRKNLVKKLRATTRAVNTRAVRRRASATDRSATAPATEPADEPQVYIIVNGTVDNVGSQCTADCLLPIAERAISCLLDANAVGSLLEAETAAWQMGYKVHLSYIPPEVGGLPSFTFDPPAMTALFNQARQRGAMDHVKRWSTRPSED